MLNVFPINGLQGVFCWVLHRDLSFFVVFEGYNCGAVLFTTCPLHVVVVNSFLVCWVGVCVVSETFRLL